MKTLSILRIPYGHNFDNSHAIVIILSFADGYIPLFQKKTSILFAMLVD
jgi:hypothetical protein